MVRVDRNRVLVATAGVLLHLLTTSAEQGDGLDELMGHLPPGGTLVLPGPSGAGKSALINALVVHDAQENGEVRAGDGKGRHTTTHELVPLPGSAGRARR